MAKDEQQNKTSADDFAARLFGDAGEMTDEDVDLLYELLAAGEPASAAVYEAAEAAAVEFRKRGVVPPEHIQAALEATRPQKTLEGAKPSLLKSIVDKLAQPVTGPVGDPAFAFRGLKELTEKDQKTLTDLTKELKQDWEKDKRT